jgi:hypothetical protein
VTGVAPGGGSVGGGNGNGGNGHKPEQHPGQGGQHGQSGQHGNAYGIHKHDGVPLGPTHKHKN